MVRLSLFLIVAWFLVTAQQPTTNPPSFATVVALLDSRLDVKSCQPDRSIQLDVLSLIDLGGRSVPKNPQLSGKIISCSQTKSGALAGVILVIDTLVLSDGRKVPVDAILQAIGPPTPPTQVGAGQSKDTDIGYGTTPELMGGVYVSGRNTMEVAARAPIIQGVLDTSSKGVVGIHHLTFENVLTERYPLWDVRSEAAPLKLDEHSQIVARIRISHHS